MTHRLLRGGSWLSDPVHCRSACRYYPLPAYANGNIGFRVCCGSIVNHVLNMNFFQDLIPLAKIPAGRFLMGSPPEEKGRFADEGPQHDVELQEFFLARTPVTQSQWRAVAELPKVVRDLNPDPSYNKGDNRPVEKVSWHDAMEFCNRLSRATGRRYTLPSEAQWEYACRAGTTTPYNCGETISKKDANFNGSGTTPVGSFPANDWGLHDMHGNVWEWCLDEWHDDYDGAPTDGSAWDAGVKRLLRGGSWFNGPVLCRSAFRNLYHPARAVDLIGFRVCCLLTCS